eukprot:TRINITY_DN25465_c0_g1_i1.p1 TRINITY_DN25465_c0_g1~~TRINITY_DN25465_c0_g1_i1.p1  ORF type:complete len:222 (+),score=118.81 TRINITY_DN25465_c0_g1_i1:101-766(+)
MAAAAGDAAKRTVFVTGVTDRVPETNLRQLLEYCGKVEDVKKQYDKESGAMGYLVVFVKVAGASQALALHGSPLDSQPISVVSEAGVAAPLTSAQQAWKDEQELLASDPSRLALRHMTPVEQLEALMKRTLEEEVKQDEAAGKPREVKITEPCYLCGSKKHLPVDCPIMKATMKDNASSSDSSSYSSSRSTRKRKRSKKDKKEKKRKKEKKDMKDKKKRRR